MEVKSKTSFFWYISALYAANMMIIYGHLSCPSLKYIFKIYYPPWVKQNYSGLWIAAESGCVLATADVTIYRPRLWLPTPPPSRGYTGPIRAAYMNIPNQGSFETIPAILLNYDTTFLNQVSSSRDCFRSLCSKVLRLYSAATRVLTI